MLKLVFFEKKVQIIFFSRAHQFKSIKICSLFESSNKSYELGSHLGLVMYHIFQKIK